MNPAQVNAQIERPLTSFTCPAGADNNAPDLCSMASRTDCRSSSRDFSQQGCCLLLEEPKACVGPLGSGRTTVVYRFVHELFQTGSFWGPTIGPSLVGGGQTVGLHPSPPSGSLPWYLFINVISIPPFHPPRWTSKWVAKVKKIQYTV